MSVKVPSGNRVLIDPAPFDGPDGEGRCIVFAGTYDYEADSAIYADVKGRFVTYRGHPWSCPNRGGGTDA